MKTKSGVWVLIALAAVLLLGSGYMMGTAIGIFLKESQEEKENQPLEKEYGISLNLEERQKRDVTNRALSEGMKALSIESEIYFKHPDATGEARIMNGAENSVCVKCTILRDSVGEIVYDSGILDPGKHIRNIRLQTPLEPGYYACTVVWTFYSLQGEMFLGETAKNIILIVGDD